MRFKIFQTEKPRRFSFHTRYYDENKLAEDTGAKVEKGSFSRYKNRYADQMGPSRAEEAKRRRRTLLVTVLIMLGITYIFIRFSNTLEKILTLFLQ